MFSRTFVAAAMGTVDFVASAAKVLMKYFASVASVLNQLINYKILKMKSKAFFCGYCGN